MRRHGFTVLEAVAAVVVLGLAIPPMLWGVRQAHAHRAGQILASRARWLASERLEEALADRHSALRGYSYITASNYPLESNIPGFPGFTRAMSIQETAADLVSPGSGFKRISCTVSYADASRTARTVILSTVVTNYAP
jgi:type II secretory pathway pseudopilin PulG